MKTIRLRMFLSLLLLAGAPSAFAATDAVTAFNNLIAGASTNAPGYYTSATRGVFTAGSLDVRIPAGAVNLISITPPTFSVGCGGISAFFGGFSFLNGSQIKKLMSDLVGNAIGYTIHIVLRTLCPMCDDILGQLQALAQKLSSGAINSCNVAQSLVNEGSKLVGFGSAAPDGNTGWCSQSASGTGGTTDYASAQSTLCGTVSAASSWIDSALSAVSAAATPSNWSNSSGLGDTITTSTMVGNTAWKTLTLAGYSNTYVKEFILSLQPLVLNSPSATSGTSKTNGKPKATSTHFSGMGATTQAAVRHALYLLLFGANPAGDKGKLANNGQPMTADLEAQIEFAKTMNVSKLPFVICQYNPTPSTKIAAPGNTPANGLTGGVSNLMLCDNPVPKMTIGQVAAKNLNPLVTNNGLIVAIANEMTDAITAVVAGEPIPKQAIEMMQVIPLPMYKVVNIAAVFPDTASQLVGIYSEFAALLVAQHVMTSWINHTSAPVSGQVTTEALAGMQQEMATMLQSVNLAIKKNAHDISTALTVQEGLLASLAQVDNVIYQSLSATGLQSNLGFSQGLAASTAQGH